LTYEYSRYRSAGVGFHPDPWVGYFWSQRYSKDGHENWTGTESGGQVRCLEDRSADNKNSSSIPTTLMREAGMDELKHSLDAELLQRDINMTKVIDYRSNEMLLAESSNLDQDPARIVSCVSE
jgi:hypothetical protein